MRRPLRGPFLAVACAVLLVAGPARAGLYWSGEEIAPLPSQWRGFLLDLRMLRNIGIKPGIGVPASPLRARYEKAAAMLEQAARDKALMADERADLGALHVRLGNVPKALEILRAGQREFPRHFRTQANLGTAWMLHGDLAQAEVCLREAVRLAPGSLQKAEELQLRLVQLRQREARGAQELDDLFGVRFVNDKGDYEAGRLGEAQRKKMPADAVAHLQQVALWLPADGRLLWQLGELAAAHGDLRTAAAILDGCVSEFALGSAALRQHRQKVRQAAEEWIKKGPGTKTEHEAHALSLKPKSSRPLGDPDAAQLPPVDPDGLNALPWGVLTQTSVDRQYRPTFPKYLKELDGKKVRLAGFIQPLLNEQDMNTFLLIEYPVGCWYCETPSLIGMVLVELPAGKSRTFTRDRVEITGKLKLNATDPEDFLFSVQGAEVKTGE